MKIRNTLLMTTLMVLSFVTARGNPLEDLPVREETLRRYQLAIGARVEIAHILGSVEIEAVDGETAEVYFVRSARTRTDLERFDHIHIEQDATRLMLRGADNSSGGIEIRHRVRLRLPKHCLLRLYEVNGKASINGMECAIRLSEINGGALLSHVSGELEMTGINGGITLSLMRLTPGGVRIRDVTGGLELRLADDLNANLELSKLETAPQLETPRATVQRVGEKQFQVRIGNGGPTIRLIDVNGMVRIRGV